MSPNSLRNSEDAANTQAQRASARVCVHGHTPSGAWIKQLIETLPSGIPVSLLGECTQATAALPSAWQRLPNIVATDDLQVLLAACAAAFPGEDLVLLRSGISLPKYWYQRLVRALTTPDVLAAGPLDNCDPRRTPLVEASSSTADVITVDALCYAYSRRLLIDCAYVSPLLSAWSGKHLNEFVANQIGKADFLDELSPWRTVLLDHLYVADPQYELRGPLPTPVGIAAAAPNPLGELREHVTEALKQKNILSTMGFLPGLDAKPVVLHILHGWGGGAERFVRDLAQSDTECTHLVLIARGDFSRRHYGERLELHDAAFSAPPLRQIALPRPITDSTNSDATYKTFLTTICRDYCVNAIYVSSLIGHSIDALRTGLPTLLIVHDFYPIWPLLHRDFGDLQLAFDSEQLVNDLHQADTEFEFLHRDPAHWQALREAYVCAALTAKARLAAPSHSALTNLLRLEPRLQTLAAEVIPHGLPCWPSGTALPILPPQRQRLRLLLPGRLRRGKGADLLRAALPQLREHADIFLLGAGSAGDEFFAEDNVNIILNYQKHDLPQLISHINPDFALLLPSVSETFSYMLSELWSLGIPVLGTALGSLAERIEPDKNGWLVKAEPAAISDAVARLAGSRDSIDRVRTYLATQSPLGMDTMLAGYRKLIPLAPCPVARHPLHNASLELIELLTLTETHGKLLRAFDTQRKVITEQQLELEQRAEWAQKLEHERNHIHQALIAAETELENRVAWVTRTEAELEDRIRWALSLCEETNNQRTYIAALIQERDALLSYRDRLLNSTSWRITAPLRRLMLAYRQIRTQGHFTGMRLHSLAGRVRGSLARRGLLGTLRRGLSEFRHTAPPALKVIPHPTPTETTTPIVLPTSPTPRVSIVIPVYNKFVYTQACLRSLAEHAGQTAFEVIVVDDNSSDETPQRLSAISGIRVLRNAQNLGFIGACNAGAAKAKGEFLLFLNNDTNVTAGWLEVLLRCFEEEPRAGLVGAKLVYPDGRLQEAGGIIFNDGSGWNYGRFEDPNDPRFNYRREVDYCSGAAILLRRTLFEQLGSFDTRYTPAYYEDTDLAFAVRTAGWKVFFEPTATVVHFEGITSGTDTASGTKRYQIVNQQKFLEKWKKQLINHPAPHTPINIAREHRACGRVLIVDAYTPTPDKDSGSLRMINLMRVLRNLGYAVSFLPENCAYMPNYSSALQALGVEVLYHPYTHPVAWLREHGALLHTIILSRHYVAANFVGLARLYAPQAQLIFDTVDLHYLREQRAAELANRPDLKRLAANTRTQELKVMRECDLTLVVSPTEQALLKKEQPQTRVEIISNVHEVYGCRQPFSVRRNLVFVGGFQHPPNIDATQFFAREIFPSLKTQLPEVEFHVIGSNMPEEIRSLAGNGIVIHGYLEDIAPMMDNCRLSVAPLRYGAGVKGKINMAMSYGLPVVATSCAVEGMHARPGLDVLVADQPEEFAAAIVRAYTDETVWNTLSANGLDNVRRYFSFDAAQTAMQKILNSGKENSAAIAY